jgi:hypothetical protein
MQKFRSDVMMEEQSPQLHSHENLRTFVIVPEWHGSKQYD